ncbi:GNAT family N-acetyltransferase [Candidatus Dependentiae bacterium]|nr:GNAT family N-acetyltransferase [Candidatus Dependentiae bacterium]
MEYRFLTINDYNDLIELWKVTGLEYKPQGRDSYESIRNEIARNPEVFLGCFEDKKLAASILITDDGRKGWLNRIAVHPDFQRRGLAQELTKRTEDILRARGIKIFAILILENNKKSLVLAEKMGYKVFEGIKYLTKRDFPDI